VLKAVMPIGASSNGVAQMFASQKVCGLYERTTAEFAKNTNSALPAERWKLRADG